MKTYGRYFIDLSASGRVWPASGALISISTWRLSGLHARIFFLVSILFAMGSSESAVSSDYAWLEVEIICNDLPAETVPSFNGPACHAGTYRNVDPQDRVVWASASVEIPERMLETGLPLGLFVSAKAASRFYWNGELLGQNGAPATGPAEETPGKIDAVFHLPRHNVRKGRNELTFVMSAHHGHLRLDAPLQVLAVGPYGNPTDIALHGYLPTFLPLGILLVGTFYFGFLAVKRRDGWATFLPPLAACFSTAQLGTELLRGFTSYSYPFHDIRLLFIVLFASLSGACLLLHVIDRFVDRRKIAVALGGFGVLALTTYYAATYDDKAAFALMSAAAVGAFIAAGAAVRKRPMAAVYAFVLAVCAVGIYETRSTFLDVYYYYLVAALLVFLFFSQIRQFAETDRLRRAEQARADRLELALVEARQKHIPQALSVKGTGTVEKVTIDQLVYCKGARDYVELVIHGAGDKLHSTSLNELEAELPSTFLRVHRSYIVNTQFIARLERDPAGSGTLHLTTGDTVPVSRRIMPSVRKALTQ